MAAANNVDFVHAGEGRRIQVRGVKRARPETGRSRREQGEACRKVRGGLLELVSYNTLS